MSNKDVDKLKVKFQNLYKEYTHYSKIFKIDLFTSFENHYNEMNINEKFGKLTPLGHMVYKFEFMTTYLNSLKDLLFLEKNELGENQ